MLKYIHNRQAFILALLLATVAGVYWPGLYGGFLFDDFWNLDALKKFGPIDNFETFLLYITSGTADPTGRPISMLSFLPNAGNWPNNPFPFKMTNLLIHLLNTILLFKMVQKIEESLSGNQTYWPAFLTAALWAAHPYFASTVLYVIQRHAMLPMTFTLLACLSWLHAAKCLESGAIKKAWLWAILGVWGFTLLGGLSKANGFLAPAMILMVYLVSQQQKQCRTMALVILAIPSAILATYLLSHLTNGLDVSGLRSFTLGERLLTEPRVLSLYMQQIMLPSPSTYTLFMGDSIAVSKSLFEPLSTFFAVSAWTLSTIIIFSFRHSYPRLFIGFFWYLTGHAMESSTLMLEIAFEHRNYLPAALIFYPIANWIVTNTLLRKSLRILIGGSILGLFFALTAQQSVLWGNPKLQAKMWERNNADSSRTIYYQTSKNVTVDEVENSLQKTIGLQNTSTKDINLAMIRISLECRLGGITEGAWEYARESAISNKKMNSGNADWLNNAVGFAIRQNCPGLTPGRLDGWLKQLLNNEFRTKNPHAKKAILNILGNLQLASGNSKEALGYYNQALDITPDYELVLVQAASLGNSGYEPEGLAHIAYFRRLGAQSKSVEFGMPRIHQWILIRTGYMEGELHRLELSLQSGSDRGN
jgi:tetratricopeptide (TPR) repeat protein